MTAKNSIQVAIKVRPLLRKEKDMPFCWRVVDNSIQLVDGQTEPYYFDHIFDESANNEDIFDKMAKHIVHAGIQGFNGTIFAYGQTSSGKTYTMMGDPVNPGVIMLAVKEIFKEIERATDRQFLLRVGYIEIYNEKIFDLLNKKNQDLKIHETPTGIVSVNCEENIVTCEEDMLQNLCVGNKERTVGETNMNERSSRSHAIFRIIIESRKVDRSEDDAVIQSVLNLVDLAGSERADQTGARGARLKEGAHINKSLLFLSNVIKRLSDNEDDKFDKYVSFRDSKLTRILQASLGGNALTSIICTIKPTAVEETQSTLSFALRAKAIKNKPQVNEVVSDATMMKRLEREVKNLKALLEEERNRNESKIKVGQLEQRIKDEDHKIISCNSLQYIRKQRDKRRRTWCPGVCSTISEEVTLQPTSILLAPSVTMALGGIKVPEDTLSSAAIMPPLEVPPKRTHLPKPNVYLTPHITLRDTPIESLPKYPILGIQTDAHIAEVDELFEPGEFCDFANLSPSQRQFDDNEKWNTCRTPEPLDPVNLRTLSLTPKATASVDINLKKAETELKELQEFTNLENKIDVQHDTYEALNQKLITLTNRNEFLEKERLEHLEVQDELNLLKQSLDDSERRCNELQLQLSNLTKTNQRDSLKITQYEKQLTELHAKLEKLEMENREAVSLEFEFERHKNKSKLRESELLQALSEKNKEVSKLEKSLNTLTEEMLQRNKENLMHLSRHSDSTPIGGGGGCSEISNGNATCVKYEDWLRLLEESKKVTLEFDKLTLEYNKLQLNFNQATLDANEAKVKLAKLEAIQHADESECDKLRTEIVTLRESLERLQQEYTQLNCDNNAKFEVCEKLNRDLHTAHDVMDHMQEKCDQLERAWSEQQTTVNEIQKEYDAILQKYQCLQAEYEKLEYTSQQSLEDCTRLHCENKKLQLDINELKLRVEQARQKLIHGPSERVEEISKLKRENIKLRAEVEDVQRQFDELQKEYNDLSNQLMDSLQDGEALREECEKFELKLKMLQEKPNEKNESRADVDKELEFVALKTSLENEIDNLKLQLEAALAKSANSGTSQISECSNETETCGSESMRSSGVCMDSGGCGSGGSCGVELLMKFTKLMETLQEIELEHEIGKVRIFKAVHQLHDSNAPPCKLLLGNFEQIVTHEHHESKGHSHNVCMQGMLKRLTFHIVKLGPSETVGELNAFDCNDTLQWSIHGGNKKENSDNNIGSMEDRQLQQELCQLNKDNAELRSLLESTECEIRELRDQINTLSAELFEKSQCLEKCACEDYQKQISSMRKELSDLSLINDFVGGVTAEMNKSVNHSDGSTDVDINETLSKAEPNECCKELQDVFDNQFKSLKEEFELELRTRQEGAKEMAAQLSSKEQLYQEEINRLQLELYGKLEVNENQFRENLRKYNSKWEEGKEEYENEIKNLKEQLEMKKNELTSVQQQLEESHKDEQQRLGDQILKLKKLYKDSLEKLSTYHDLEKISKQQQLSMDKLKEHNDELQVEYEIQKRENDLFNVELPILKEDLNKQKRQSNKELHALMCNRAELLKTIQSQLQIITMLSQETENLKATLEDQESGSCLKNTKCENASGEVLKSENTFDVLRQEKNMMEIMLVQLKSEKSVTESKFENSLVEQRQQKETILDQRREIHKLQLTLDQLQSKKSESKVIQQSNIEQLLTELSAFEVKTQKELEVTQQQKDNLQLSLNQLKNEESAVQLNYENSLETQRQQKNKIGPKSGNFAIESKYESDLKELRKRKCSLESMLSGLESEISKYEQNLEMLRKNKEAWLYQLESEKSLLKSQHETDLLILRKERDNLQLSLNNIESEKSDIQFRYENSSEIQQQQKDQFDQFDSEYKNDLGALLEERDNLKLALDKLESEKFEYKTDVEVLRKDKEKLIDQLNSEKSSLELKYKKSFEVLQKAQEDLQLALNKFKSEKSIIQSKYENLLEIQREQKDELYQLESAKSAIKSKYENDLEQLQNDRDNLQLMLDQLEIKHTNIQSEYENCLEVFRGQKDRLDQLESEKSVIESKYKNDLEKPQKEINYLELKLNQLRTDKSDVQSKYEKSLETLQLQKDQLGQLESEKATLESKYENSEKTLKEDRQTLLDQLNSKKSTIESKYESDLGELRRERDNLQLTIDELEREKSDIKAMYEITVKERGQETLLDEIKHKNELISENDLEALRQERDNLKLTLSQIIEAKSAVEFKYENDLEERRKERDNLQLTLDQIKNEKSALESKYEKLIRFEKVAIESKCLEKETILDQLNTESSEIEAKYKESLKMLREENENLQLTVNQLKKEKLWIEEKEETLNLKIDDLSQELHDMKTKMLGYEQLLSEHEESEKALSEANTENHKLSLQIQTLEDALNDALKFTIHMTEECVKVSDLEKQLQSAKEESIAATREQQSLLTQLETLKNKITSEEQALQCQNKELQGSIAEIRIKCDSLQQANERLQQENANLNMQLKATEVSTSECIKLRTELSTLKLERDKLELHIKTTADEATKCSDALRLEVTQQKQLVEQHLQSYNRLRTLLNSKETIHKDDKQKLEGTISCLLLEKKNLEDRLHLSEVALKRYENEFTTSQLRFESANSSIELNTSCSPRSKRLSAERGTSEVYPLKSVVDFEDKVSILQKKTSQIESMERKNRRLSTHDERRRQSLLGVKHNTASMTEPFETKCTKCVDLERKLKDCEMDLFINESRVTALQIELKNHPLKAENASLKKRLQEEQDKNRIEIKRYKQILLEKTVKATNAIDSAASATAAKEPKICKNIETQTESNLEESLLKLQSKYNDIMSICRFRYKYIMELEEKVGQKENTGDNRSGSALEAGEIKALKSECDLLKRELTVCQKKYEDAKKVLHKRREEIERLTALVPK